MINRNSFLSTALAAIALALISALTGGCAGDTLGVRDIDFGGRVVTLLPLKDDNRVIREAGWDVQSGIVSAARMSHAEDRLTTSDSSDVKQVYKVYSQSGGAGPRRSEC
jgi:hypothetical protein